MMEQITLGDISNVLVFIASLLTAGSVIVGFTLKRVKVIMNNALEPTNKKIDNLSTHIEAVDMANCKNYLVSTISDVQNGVALDSVARERFYENYDHYIAMGGNSYVKSAVEKLKKEGKL